jgi:hypothetical protein
MDTDRPQRLPIIPDKAFHNSLFEELKHLLRTKPNQATDLRSTSSKTMGTIAYISLVNFLFIEGRY